MNFKELHQQEHPLLIANVWDIPSVKMAEKAGFEAIGTSSAAIAHTLGYEDGQEISFQELYDMVKRITSCTSLPVSVDLEGGYGKNTAEILENIQKLYELNISGINIEDSIVINSERKLLNPQEFSKTISVIRNYIHNNNIDLFLNIRTDTFLLDITNTLEQTLSRIQQYESAGADGIFIPGVVSSGDISKIVSAVALPVNVMSMPDLPVFEKLADLGVKRISTGNFLHQYIYDQFYQKLMEIKKDQSFKSLFLENANI